MSNKPPYYTAELPSGALLAVNKLPPRDTLQRGEYRAMERQAWQALARQLLNDPNAHFDYSAIGAPFIVGSHLHISVSHSAELVAVILSPQPCAVDIEALTRNFERVASRYISPDEELLFGSLNSYKASIWSIKECLYKYAGVKELDLLNDLRVTSMESDRFSGWIASPQNTVKGFISVIAGHTLVYIG
ncbi:MAG: 4'-phosphopantetheinyl transferase superfamily protein [Rikenellaceae bacterium]